MTAGEGKLVRATLAQQVNQNIGLNKREAQEVVASVIEEICAALSRGEEVKLSELGHFRPQRRQTRPGRNPRTGESVPVPARCAISFQPGPKLKAQLGQSNG